MRIALWDDGDYDIVAYHNRGSSEREQVFYDNESGAIYWQHTKQDPDWMFPDPNDLSEGEERVVVPEYEINEVRRLSELE